jgi:murein DD-endopeptidase MepM/ murein hydrolase activator NlpD
VNRLLLFLFGIVVGAAGMYLLYWSGNLPPHSPTVVAERVEPAPAQNPPGFVPLPGTNEPELPAMPPAATASVEAPAPAMGLEPLAPPEQGEPSTPTPSANASEVPVPTTPEAAAAVTAAATTQGLLLPVQGVQAKQLTDTFTQSRGTGRLHDAIDIMAARGTPVLAVADGRVAKLFTSKPGGLTVYQFDGAEKLAYYYAHLDHYADGLAEGRVLKRGEILGYVGSTGNASPEAPHLHFAVFVLGPEKHWWQGTAVNPYPLLGGR